MEILHEDSVKSSDDACKNCFKQKEKETIYGIRILTSEWAFSTSG